MNREYSELAFELTEAMKRLCSNEYNLRNFEFYLSMHFGAWMERFASTPESLVEEIKSFADMEI